MQQCTKPRARFRQRGSNLILKSFNTLIKKSNVLTDSS